LETRENVYLGKTIPEVLEATTETMGSTTSSVGRTSRAIWRGYILEAINNSTISPLVYKEVLRSLIVSFGNLHYVTGDNKLTRIKSMHAAGERAVAKKFQENNVILPIITIHQLSAKGDDSKRRYDNLLIQNSVWDEDKQRAERVIGLADVPVTITFSVNLWTKYMEDLDQISQSIRLRFNPSLDLQTDFSDDLKAFLVDETNNTAIDAGDRETRLIRKTFSVSTELFIPSPKFKVTSTGRVEKIVSNLWVS
tara:strand:+ start:417 stop:1172 length:756 start_codon:yes stop_codon:yes gene_type:complete